jgi:LacI family transcriptional regulator
MGNSATLKKISEHLNVSISTVSRALKDHPDVSPETKKRVKELALLLDYEPNAFAVNLRKKHSNLFAVVVPEINSFFYHSFIQAVEEEARRIGYSMMILQSMNSPEVEEQNLRLCRYNHVAGVLVALTGQTRHLEPFRKIEAQDIPLIFFDKVPADDTFNKVSIADYECGRLAAEVLHNSRYGKILAIMGSPQLSITQRREAGFRDYCAQQANPLPLELVYADRGEEAQQHIIDYYSRPGQPPTAVFAMSDEILCGTVKGLHAMRMEWPRDAGLLAISNGFFPTLFSPEINFVRTSGYDLGKLAFTRLQEIMAGKKFVRENFLTATYHPGGSL